jgi:nitrous oxide reductase accessory protein NosL
MSSGLRSHAIAALLVAMTCTAGCERERADLPAPPPVEIGADATGHYCGMLLSAHEGPKGQIHLAKRTQPVWFSSVRDTIAFTRLPEEPRDITAIYVSDMARSRHYEQPDAGAWVEARQAWFVGESDMRGGMGAPEAVPFSDPQSAEAFRARYGGRVVKLADIPDSYVLGPVNLGAGAAAKPQ